MTAPAVGTRVRIQRDETRYPSKGTWPQFRGKVGTVVEINTDKRPHLTEVGVVFGKVTPAPPGHNRQYNWDTADVVWFKTYEVCPLASVRNAETTTTTRQGDWSLAQ